MTDLNERALEAAQRAHRKRGRSAAHTITAYFDSLAEQGIRLVDVRDVARWLFARAEEVGGDYATAVKDATAFLNWTFTQPEGSVYKLKPEDKPRLVDVREVAEFVRSLAEFGAGRRASPYFADAIEGRFTPEAS